MYILKYEGILSKHVHNSSMLRYLSHTSAKESQQKGSTRIVDLIFDPFPSTSCPSQVGPSRISRVSGEPAWYLPFLDQDELQIEINEYMHKWIEKYLMFKLNRRKGILSTHVHNNSIVRDLGHTSARDIQKMINKDSWSHFWLVSKYYLSKTHVAIQDFQGEWGTSLISTFRTAWAADRN